MADEEQDPFHSITDDFRFSSSQEELFSHAKFARDDETFSDGESLAAAERSGVSRRKLDGADDSGGRHGGDFVAVDSDSARAKNLGFRGERKGSREGEPSGTKSERFCGGKSEIEPQLKKSNVSPLIHCRGKMVIEKKDDEDEVVVLSGELKLKMASSSRSNVPESEECTEKLDSEDGRDFHVDGEMRLESGAKKKLECSLETKVIDVEEDEEEIMRVNREKCNADKEGKDDGEDRGKVEDDEKQGDGTSTREEKEEDITRRGKRELPRSMFGLVWGDGNEEIENGDIEDGFKEASVVKKRDGEFKGGEGKAIRCILDVLRMFVSEECSNDDNEIDVLETVKQRGMTFPRSRFLPEVEEEEEEEDE